ncbi:hypothetical protein [Archangium violaceum]
MRTSSLNGCSTTATPTLAGSVRTAVANDGSLLVTDDAHGVIYRVSYSGG